MPELPEVETLARQLAPLAEGRRVLAFEIFDTKLAIDRPEVIRGMRINSLRRVGKQIVIELSKPGNAKGCGGRLWLGIHLRMTGRLIWSETAECDPPRKLRARLSLGGRLRLDRGWLLFQDTRRFGTMRLYDSAQIFEPVGLDPTHHNFGAKALERCTAGARQPIKPWLLRQDRLVGLGNIYACEALFRAGLSPRRAAGSLTAPECRRLATAIRRVLAQAIAHGGTTISDYQNARGESGNYHRRLAVYGRAGLPCPHCRTPIERLVQAGRSTFHCPTCQGDH